LLANLTFNVISVQWFFERCNAQTAFNYKDLVMYFAGNPAGYGSILYIGECSNSFRMEVEK
jgi:hypothetical protein